MLYDSLVECNGYDLFHSDRGSHAGGVAIYVSKRLNAKFFCKLPSDSSVECIFVQITNTLYSSKTLTVCVYRPNRFIDYQSVIDLLSSMSIPFSDVILAGDFNSKPLLA